MRLVYNHLIGILPGMQFGERRERGIRIDKLPFRLYNNLIVEKTIIERRATK